MNAWVSGGHRRPVVADGEQDRSARVIRFQVEAFVGAGGGEAARLLGSAAVVVGAFELSVPFLAAAAATLRGQGRLGQLSRILVMQGWSATCLADWQLAVPVLDEAVRLATETGEAVWAAGGQAMKAILAALRGEPAMAAALTLEAEQSVISTGATHMLAYVQVARGLTALGEGRHADAYAELHRIFDRADPAHHVVPCCWYIGDLAEAAVHSDHRVEARALLEELQPLIEHTKSSWIQTAMRFARAQLADDAEADVVFQEALDGRHDAVAVPARPIASGARCMAASPAARLRIEESVALGARHLRRAGCDPVGRACTSRAAGNRGDQPPAGSRGLGQTLSSGDPDCHAWRPRVCPIARLAESCTCHTGQLARICTERFRSWALPLEYN